jgi:TIR domain
MARDVFISHAHKDKQIAEAICEKLESAQVKCWIAQRDMPVGGDWTEATRNAIGSSHLMVLLLSENAAAAVHMEREIAHAFYTKRIIITLRLTDTLPRRDLLFYLGNARSYDAFGPIAEQQLEAFSTAIQGMVQGRTGSREATSFHRAQGATARPIFSESWIGAFQASHYRTMEILKPVAIVASAAGAICLLWFFHQQNEREASLGEGSLPARQSSSHASLDLPPPLPSADVSKTKPAYAYTRFGLWVTPNAGATPATQQGLQDPFALSKDSQPTRPTLPPRGDSETTAEGESLQDQDQNMNSAPADRPRTGTRRPGHRGKSRLKNPQKKAAASLGRRIAQIKRRLSAAWQHLALRGK